MTLPAVLVLMCGSLSEYGTYSGFYCLKWGPGRYAKGCHRGLEKTAPPRSPESLILYMKSQ